MKKILLLCAGSISLALGVVGIFLPVLPTTPFLLLAAACFSASSQRLHRFLTRNKYLGAYLDNYKNKFGVPLQSKSPAWPACGQCWHCRRC